MDPMQRVLHQLLQPASIIAIALMIGIFIERVTLPWLDNLAKRTPWGIDDFIISLLRKGIVMLWAAILGVYVAVQDVGLGSVHLQYVHAILLVIFIVSIMVIVPRLITGFVFLTSDVSELSSLSIFNNIVKITVYILGVLFILNLFNIPITPALAAVGVGSLGISFALQDTFANLFSGVQLTVSRRIRPGDYIRLSSGEEGYVADINWNNTQIKQWDNNMVIVPNSVLTNTLMTNFHDQGKQMLVWVNAKVSYTSNLPRVEQQTLDVVKDTIQRCLDEPTAEAMARTVVRRLTHGASPGETAESVVSLFQECAIFHDMALDIVQKLEVEVMKNILKELREGTFLEEIIKEVMREQKGKDAVSEEAIEAIINQLRECDFFEHIAREITNEINQQAIVVDVELVRKFTAEIKKHAVLREKIRDISYHHKTHQITEEFVHTLVQQFHASTVLKDITKDVQGKMNPDEPALFHHIIEKVQRRIRKGACAAYEPFIRYNTFDDFSINFGVFFYIREFMSQYLLKHEVIKALHHRFEQEGIEIPLPTGSIHIRDGHLHPTTSHPATFFPPAEEKNA
jgi:small-conductance mechanosensitive channel